MYEAMARRYRPHTFDDVIGQEHVAQTLKNSIAAERVAHAYLFCGPHGCGKTSMARIFACALVCENGPTDSPCGRCAICQDVLKGQDIDVQEIDGASNNGVEQVRALREQVGYVPSRARYKIYIIDEVHMLSVAAFNALLKTLEEPPAHVKFILATTDPHKIIGTILSRCQRFDFRLIPPSKMTLYLKRLIESEDAQITDDALAAVAAFSGGSMRDGLVLLDQLVSFSSGSVTREDVERVRGVAGAESVAGLFESIASHDLVRALKLVDAVSSRGTNVGDFIDQLISFGRDLMHVIAVGSDEGVTAYGPAKNMLLELSSELTLEQILLMLDVLTQARTRIRSKALSNPLVALEMAIARLAGLESLSPVGDIVEKLSAYASGAPLPEITERIAVKKNPVQAVDTGSLPSEPIETNYTENEREVGEQQRGPIHEQSSSLQTDENEVVSSEPVHGYVPKNEEVNFCEEQTSDLPWREEIISTGPLSAETTVNIVRNADVEEVEDTANIEGEAGVSVEPPQQASQTFQKDVAGNSDIDLKELWSRILVSLSSKSRTDAPFMSDAYIDRYEPGALFLSVPGGGTFIYEQLEEKHRKQRIADSASEILGSQVSIHLVLRDAITTEYANGSAVASGADSGHSEQFVSPAQKMMDAGRERGVKVILENFEGSIINIEDA